MLKSPPGKRGIRAAVACLILLGLGLGHTMILQMLTWPVVVEQGGAEQGRAGGVLAEADYLCLHGGELGADGFHALDRAAAWYAESPGRRILLMLPLTHRIVEIGAARSFEETSRRELAAHGIPDGAVGSIHADARDFWDEAHAMSDWLKEHPKADVAWACGDYTSGRLRYVVDKVLGAKLASQVHLAVMSDESLSPNRWWRSRNGVKDLMFAWLSMVYVWTEGENRPASTPRSAAQFQADARATLGEASP